MRISHKYRSTHLYKRGLSLAEILVVVAIISLLAVAVGHFTRDVFYLGQVNSNILSAATDARVIVKTITRELRVMSQGSNGAYPIVQAATNTITFFSDIDGDGIQDQVRYFIDNTTLRRGVIKPTGGNPWVYNSANEVQSILAKDIRNGTTSLLQYYDSSYTGTTLPMTYPLNITAIRLIKITLMVDADPSRAPVIKTYTTQVSLRNLKDNL